MPLSSTWGEAAGYPPQAEVFPVLDKPYHFHPYPESKP